MDYMSIAFPISDPVAIHLGPVSVRWYGLAYMAGLLLGWLYMRRLVNEPTLWAGPVPMRVEQADDFLFWATIGTVLGGRIGFFLLYEPSTLFHDPIEFLKLAKGGMAFHGGLLGVGLAICLFSRRNRIPVRSLMDLCAAVVPFGLFFGRVANFVNAEIYGKLSSVPWAVDFPLDHISYADKRSCIAQNVTDCGVRHPTQLYEAALEGVAMFLIIRYFTHSRLAFRSPGFVTGVFLASYGAFRIIAEYFKEWDRDQFFTTAYFSEGVVYSIPMIALGAYLIITARTGSTMPTSAHASTAAARA